MEQAVKVQQTASSLEPIFANVFIDFDNTLFDTYRLKAGMERIFVSHGVRSEDFEATLTRAIRGENGHYFDFTFELHVDLLKRLGYALPEAPIITALEDLLKTNFVAPDAHDFLRFIQPLTKRLMLLTGGNPDFQAKKIQAAGIAPYFDEIYILNEKKEAYVASIVRAGEHNVFINDDIEQNILIKRLFPEMTVLTVKHKERYTEDELIASGLPFFMSLSEIKTYVTNTYLN